MVDMTFYNPIVLKKITGTARTLKSYYDRIKEFMGGCDTCPYCNGRGCDFCCGAKGGCCGGTLSLKKLKKKELKDYAKKLGILKKDSTKMTVSELRKVIKHRLDTTVRKKKLIKC